MVLWCQCSHSILRHSPVSHAYFTVWLAMMHFTSDVDSLIHWFEGGVVSPTELFPQSLVPPPLGKISRYFLGACPMAGVLCTPSALHALVYYPMKVPSSPHHPCMKPWSFSTRTYPCTGYSTAKPLSEKISGRTQWRVPAVYMSSKRPFKLGLSTLLRPVIWIIIGVIYNDT